MKCDDCKNSVGEGASMDCPYPSVWCKKGHWDGPDLGPEPEIDPWENCEDYEARAKVAGEK